MTHNECPECAEARSATETAPDAVSDVFETEEMKRLIGKAYGSYKESFGKKLSFNTSAFLFAPSGTRTDACSSTVFC